MANNCVCHTSGSMHIRVLMKFQTFIATYVHAGMAITIKSEPI